MAISEEFKALGLSEQMLEAISEKGFEIPSPIQALAIPVLLNSTNDIIAQAQTGTGKTATFGLPILDKLKPSKGGVKALILVPTRELALQVTDELLSFNHAKKLSIAAIYGGASMSEQLRRLKKGIDIVVGTPGRILDHLRRGTLMLDAAEYLILDEADEMLNMGFIDDIEEIMQKMSSSKRTMLFSATMPSRIVQLSKKYMHNTQILKVEARQVTTDLTNQIYFEVKESDKFDALTRIIDVEPEFYGIVFSRTKIGVDETVTKLIERGYAAEGLHGDVSQAQREKILRKFKAKRANILVATDVAARGIDINNLTHVINYSLPQDSESYVHRIGRTGRAGNQGTAITFISSSEMRRFSFMQKDVKAEIKREKLPTAQDVVSIKRTKIKDDVRSIVEAGSFTDYADMAKEILEVTEPEVALGALLKLAFKNDLSESNYHEIRTFSVDRRGKARIFLAVGRLDGYDARKIVALLKRECGLNDNSIDDIKVTDSFSFATVPFADAEKVVRKLNAMRKGGRPLAEIAKDSHEAGDRSQHGSAERSQRGSGERRSREEKTSRDESRSRRERARERDSKDFESTPSRDTKEYEPRKRTASESDLKEPKADRKPAKAAGKSSGDFDADVFSQFEIKSDRGGHTPPNDENWFSVFEERFGAEPSATEKPKKKTSAAGKKTETTRSYGVRTKASPKERKETRREKKDKRVRK